MNATIWPSLGAFVKHLGKVGLCKIDKTEKGRGEERRGEERRRVFDFVCFVHVCFVMFCFRFVLFCFIAWEFKLDLTLLFLVLHCVLTRRVVRAVH
jgi:hypothetical protein